MIKSCKTCDYGMLNEINDLVCVNDASLRCAEFVYPHESCEHWQNYDVEFFGDK